MEPTTPGTQTPGTQTVTEKPHWQAALEAAEPVEAPVQTTEKPEVETPVATPAPVVPATSQQVVQMSEENLAKLVDSFSARQTQSAPAKQLTEDELNKMFNVYKASEAQILALGLEVTPERIAVMNEMLQGAARQAASVSSFHTAQLMEQLREEIKTQFNPVAAFVQQQHAEQMKARFYTAYPNLKGLEPLLVKIRDSFMQQGKRFASEAEAFKAVAEEAQKDIKSMGMTLPTAQGGGGNEAPATNTNGRRSSGMPTLSGGGQGGAGDSARSANQVKGWQKALS